MTPSSKDEENLTSEDSEEKAVQKVLGCKDESEEFYESQFKEFNYFDQLYIKGASKSNIPYGRANLQVPIAYQQAETFVAIMLNVQIDEKPYIQYGARGREDQEIAEAVTDFAQYQLDQGDFEICHEGILRDIVTKGTGVVKVVWETDSITYEEEVTQSRIIPQLDETGAPLIDPQTGEPIVTVEEYTEIVENEEITFDGMKFYDRKLTDFLVPKSATGPNVQELEWCIDRSYRTIDELLNNPNYKNKSKLKKMRDGASKASPDMKDFQRTEIDSTSHGQSSKKFTGKVEVLEWWGDFKIDGRVQPALITVGLVGEEPILLRLDKNPFKYKFKPFVATNYVRKKGSFYGYGSFHHIKGLVEEATALRNARLDAANMSLNPMWLADRMAGLNTRQLYAMPNKIVFANDINGLKKLEFSGVTVASVQELARMDFDINNTTDIQSPSQGGTNVGGAFSDTATGVNFIANKSNLRMKAIAKMMEKTYFKPLAMMMLMYNKDMIEDDEERFFRVLEDRENPYSRSVTGASFTRVTDFIPSASPEKFSVDEIRNNIGYFMQTLGQLMGTDPRIRIKSDKAIKTLAKAAGIPHAEDLVELSPPQIFQTPDGQVIDDKGQPVQVVPLDETGQPVTPDAMGGMIG